MSALDTIFNILKGAHPDASDEDIKSYIDSAKASPDQMNSAVAPLSMDKAPDMSLNIPAANDTKSNFDMPVSDNTVTQNGSAASVTSQPSQVPPPVTPDPETPPVASTDNANTAKSVVDVAKPSGAVDEPNTGDAQLKAAIAPTAKTGDSDAELAMKKKNQNLKLTGGLAGLAGGIGDAIGNAAIPFGGKGSSGTQEQILENTNKEVASNKAAFEEKEKKDPTSDVSRHYQKVLGLMLGAHAKGMGVDKMSAEHIAATLPEVEKYMQKELGMQQIRSNKDLQTSLHEQGRQDKLEKDAREWVDYLSKARNGEIGVQNAKVDQARHLLQVYKQSEETGQPIPNAQYGEIAIGAANLVAGGAQNVSDHTRQMIMQSTAQGDLNKALTYAGFDPSTLGGSTPSVLKNLKHLIMRQGTEAENQRDKFINDQKKFIPSGLDPEKAQKLVDANFGNSMKEFTQPTTKAPPKASAPEGTTKTIGNRQFTVMNGIWHEIGH